MALVYGEDNEDHAKGYFHLRTAEQFVDSQGQSCRRGAPIAWGLLQRRLMDVGRKEKSHQRGHYSNEARCDEPEFQRSIVGCVCGRSVLYQTCLFPEAPQQCVVAGLKWIRVQVRVEYKIQPAPWKDEAFRAYVADERMPCDAAGQDLVSRKHGPCQKSLIAQNPVVEPDDRKGQVKGCH